MAWQKCGLQYDKTWRPATTLTNGATLKSQMSKNFKQNKYGTIRLFKIKQN